VSDAKAPYLIVAAFWSDTDVTDDVTAALNHEVFPRAPGRRGAVVSFKFATADRPDFRRVMERLGLAEVNDHRPGFTAVTGARS